VNVQLDQETLRITGVRRLSAANARAFRNEVRAALQPGLRTIAIDLSEISFLDSSGLAALLALQKTASRHHGPVTVRLLNPSRPAQQLLGLTRLDRVFEIAP
jgi:anti-sigma B factor antagonist